MKSLVIFALLLTASPAFSRNWHTGMAGEKWDYNCDFYGHDLRQIAGVERSDCGPLCVYEPKCTHFTHGGHDSKCFLKHSSEAFYENVQTDGKMCGFVLGRSSQRP